VRSQGGPSQVLVFGLFMLAALLVAGSARALTQCGEAAWYPPGGLTASGEPNVDGALTAAHRDLPFGTRVSVRNLANGKSVVLHINDRGGFSGKRIIDVSRAAAEALGFISHGVAPVEVTVLGDVDVKLPRTCRPTAGTTVLVNHDEGPAKGPDKPAASRPAAAPTRAEQGLGARFNTAFQPESWAEAELKKALEAILPAPRR
jgi:rare lipoprotein A